MTKDIFEEITKHRPINFNKQKIDITFKIAWAEILQLSEITYMDTKLKKVLFSRTKIIRSEVLFVESNQYTVLYLNQNKSNIEHTRVQIVLAVTDNKTYLVAALDCLYALDL